MNKEIKEKWVKALRSGEYSQVAGMLVSYENEDDHRFCCLGVLCNIHAEETEKGWYNDEGCYIPDRACAGSACALPGRVVKWAGLDDIDPEIVDENKIPTTLSELNDDGGTFKQIAKIIEAQF